MSAQQKVAVVTGSNKGIGFAIVKGLCEQFKGTVILTARDVGRGQKAVEELKAAGLSPVFHQLDIESAESAQTLRKYLVDNYGGLDVLVNNAGFAFKAAAKESFLEQAEVSNRINFLGTLNVCDALFPILRPHARVVHVSSQVSTMALGRCSDQLKKQWTSATTIDQCTALIKQFISDVRDGKHSERGWPDSAYGVSKLGVTSVTPIQQEALNKDSREDIVVNACCPGYVNTDMTSHKGKLTVEQGADTPVYLALLPPNTKTPRGDFLNKRKVIDWKKPHTTSWT